MRALRAVVAAAAILLIVVFALSNRQLVSVSAWPTDLTWEVPLSIVVLAASAVFFVAGALLGSRGAAAARRRARQAEARLRVVEAQRPVSAGVPLLARHGA